MKPTPLLSLTFFDTRNFLKHRRAPLRNDSVLWDKKILRENRETHLLSYPEQFLIPETFWNTEGFLYEMIRYWDEKFWGKIVKPTSSLIPNIFRYPKPFETLPLRNDTVDKTILVENRNTRPLSYPERFSIPESNETLKNSPTKIFSTVRQKKSSETLDAPPPILSMNLFAIGKFLKHITEGFPYESFRYSETTNFL